MSLGKKTLEGKFIELILKMLLIHHRFKFCIECLGVFFAHFLNAETLTSSIFHTTGLADFKDRTFLVNNNLHLLLSKFMPYEGKYIVRFISQYSCYNLRIIESP